MSRNSILLEICCGSLEDALAAAAGGADRIELNSALYLGGLTPSMATLLAVRESCPIPVIAMVRPRGGGFCYPESTYRLMLREAELLLKNGADGLAFGFLHEDRSLQVERTRAFVELIHSYGREAVFHRAIDCVPDQEQVMDALITCGVDRVLTSGGRATAWEGREQIARLQKQYGQEMQILPGSGLRKENAVEFVRQTGVGQIHSSCRGWEKDGTGVTNQVSFAYCPGEHASDYEAVDRTEVCGLKASLEAQALATACKDGSSI